MSFPQFRKSKTKKCTNQNHMRKKKKKNQLVSKHTPTCNKMAVLCWLFIKLLMDSKSLLIDSSNSVCSLPSYNLLRDVLGYPFRIRKFHSCKCTRFNVTLKIYFISCSNITYVDISPMSYICYSLYWVETLQLEHNIKRFQFF